MGGTQFPCTHLSPSQSFNFPPSDPSFERTLGQARESPQQEQVGGIWATTSPSKSVAAPLLPLTLEPQGSQGPSIGLGWFGCGEEEALERQVLPPHS